MTGEDVVKAARMFLGVRYMHQGRTGAGLDCIGLPVVVRQVLRLPALDSEPGYSRT